MNATAIALLGLASSFGPVDVERGVVECRQRGFDIPYLLEKDKIGKVRLFTSADRGKTWEEELDHDAAAGRFRIEAPSDGLFWFALQLVHKDGTSYPNQNAPLEPALKVYVNSQRRVLRDPGDPSRIV